MLIRELDTLDYLNLAFTRELFVDNQWFSAQWPYPSRHERIQAVDMVANHHSCYRISRLVESHFTADMESLQ
jgi:hypothetical protein